MSLRNYIVPGGLILLIMLSLLHITECHAQRSVIDLFKSDRTLADQAFARGEITEAIKLYERTNKWESRLMLGRAYYLVKEYRKSIDAYDAYVKSGKKLDMADYHTYAEASLTLKNYLQARENFQKVLNLDPANQSVIKKMWRISNMHYLYEDSIHFATRLLTINTPHAEWGGVAFTNEFLFLSNRPSGNPVLQLDAATHQSFYSMYSAKEKPDTLLDGWSKLHAKPGLYAKAPSVTANAAGFSIYDRGTKMIFTASSSEKNAKGQRTLGLYFGELKGGEWTVVRAFDHNSTTWSSTDPTIDTVNHVLYFASDKAEGYGRMDIYQSQWINDRWTDPVNLGEAVNTAGDEVFPYFHQGMLYFSSNGQPGMGGLDIFKICAANQSDEPVNLGYPMNSSYDDFAITFTNNKGNHGFFSSNRKRGGLDDDIYEFDMDMQTYPFEITGIIKQMDHSWNKDSGQVHILKKAKILLVDNIRNVTVQETKSDETGAFQLWIPYFSKYAIHVVDSEGVVNTAVFDVPRQRKESTVHEIVVVKDIFQGITK